MKILVILALLPVAFSQSIVIGTRTSAGNISFEPVEDFQISQSHKIRLLPDQKGDLDPNTVRRLNKIDLPQAGIISNDGTGRLVSLNGPTLPRDLVIPENYPGRLSLAVTRNRGSKQNEPLPPESFVVVLFGPAPDEAVRDFIGKDWAFLSVDEQLAAMRGFLASFPSSPAKKEFRDALERRISAALARLEEGGPYSDLLTTHRFSDLARRTFPGDAPLQALDDRIADRIKFITDRSSLLHSLAALGDWDTLLDKYQDFERYESSFPDMRALQQEALEESARMHAGRARAFEQRGDFARAAREASVALSRDPSNPELRKLFNDENVLASQGEALANASRRKILPQGLPADIRFGNALSDAGQAIAAKDFKKAEASIQDADRENPGAPEVVLLRAKLLAAQGRGSEAIPLLDQYDRLVINSTDREKGYEVRRQVVADLDSWKQTTRQQIAALLKDGQYSQLDPLLRAALARDGDDPEFLYQAGVVAAVLRDKERAKIVLAKFIAHANAIGVDPRQRERARRILAIINDEKPTPRPALSSNALYYDPQSLAFQIPIADLTANGVRMAFNWTNGRLDSIRTTFADDKGAQLYRALVIAGAADSGAVGAAAMDNPGNFFFAYHPSGALHEVLPKPAVAATPYNVHVVHDAKGHVQLLDADGRPEVVLPDHPYIDPSVLAVVEGAPVTAIVSGNSFFNPFIWDGIHLFTVQYDRQGRADSAQEWNADNLVRFTWDGSQLTAVRAYHHGSDAPYYQRTISYTGPAIAAEDYSINGRTGKIRYVYNGKNLQPIKIENDGKEWTARPRS